MTRHALSPVFAAALFAAVGCGAEARKTASTRVTSATGPVVLTRQHGEGEPVADAAPTPVPGGKPAGPAEMPIERKIIFNGHLELVVKDFDAARAEVTKLVEGNKGYFAKTEVAGDAGSKRTGTFTVKVPAERFQLTVDALTKLGVATRNSTDSQDVTEEFVDVTARVKNLKAEEEVLNRLLKDAAGRLDDLFKIREQIRQVRGDIERAEGRLKALSTLASLSTIVLTLREESAYVPPTVDAPPTFAGRVSASFGGSLGLLQLAGEWVVIAVVAAAPWLPIFVLLVVLLRWAVRPPAARPAG